jgi:hypothetical protein
VILRQPIVERLQPTFNLKTIEVGLAFQLSFKSGPKKERAGARAFAELRAQFLVLL